MNTVTPRPLQKKFEWTGKADDLIGTNFGSRRTAFIGHCGAGEEESLYLVTYKCISYASAPWLTWNGPNCDVKVIRFVDVNISVVEREERN